MIINFFGCSFTEGAGLDYIEYYEFLTGKKFTILDSEQKKIEEVIFFKNENRYSKIVENILDVETLNYGIAGNSNDGILKNLMDVVNLETTKKGDIFVVQTTEFSRKYYWYEPFDKFINMNISTSSDYQNKVDRELRPLYELHNMNLKYCYNEKYEIDKLIQNIKMYSAYFEKIGLKLFWVPWFDFTLEPNPLKVKLFNEKMAEENQNIIFFEDMTMNRYCANNELLILNDFNKLFDYHKSLKGHRVIGEIIANYLKNKL